MAEHRTHSLDPNRGRGRLSVETGARGPGASTMRDDVSHRLGTSWSDWTVRMTPGSTKSPTNWP